MDGFIVVFLVISSIALAFLGPRHGVDTRDGRDWQGGPERETGRPRVTGRAPRR